MEGENVAETSPIIIEEATAIGPTVEERLGRIEHKLGELVARVEGHEGRYHPDEPESEEPDEESAPEPESRRDAQPESTHPWARKIGGR